VEKPIPLYMLDKAHVHISLFFFFLFERFSLFFLIEVLFTRYICLNTLVVRICCIGTGFVGSPRMAVVALKCPSIEVVVVNISKSCIAAWNNDQLIPIYEPSLMM